MNILENFSLRLKRIDILQLAFGLFAILIAGIIFTWPANAAKANNSFFTVSTIRVSLLALSAFFFAAYGSSAAREDQLADILALMFLALVSAPLEILSYSLSLPSISPFWSTPLAILDILAYFSLGLLMAKVLAYLRLKLLTSMFVLGAFFALFWLDLRLGRAVFSPISAAWHYSLFHVVAMLLLSSYTVYRLGIAKPRESASDD